ncbi:MAG: glycogen synthase [Lachnospiraceae bacterium]|jgi:starch synthase|nr:glycogen synthase [Lachnospiraceae bacterium]
MSEKIKVLLVGAECAGFVKIGGLADVMGTLPGKLQDLGVDARVMIPFHRAIKDEYYSMTKHLTQFYVPVGNNAFYVGIETLTKDGICYYFVDCEDMFGGPVYKGGGAEGEQYAYFCLAVCESLDRIGFVPDVIHANDWQTGMIAELLHTQFGYRPQGECKTVYTIHNMQYQGDFGFDAIKFWLHLNEKDRRPNYSFTKSAIHNSDWVNTVSPTYAKEIMTKEYGCSLESDIKAIASNLSGIVNGINKEEFDPAKDSLIKKTYDIKTFTSGKKANKAELVRRCGLDIDIANTPVIGMVSRLVEQKGLGLFFEIAHRIMKEDVAFVFLGTGEPDIEQGLLRLAAEYPGRIATLIKYDNEIAHLIYAGSDAFFMPSRFEPCGISQMIGQAYGTPPIVRKTGGLCDTVTAFDAKSGKGDGFSFTDYSPEALYRAIKGALKILKDKDLKKQVIKNGMKLDNGFEKSALKYKEMYEDIL